MSNPSSPSPPCSPPKPLLLFPPPTAAAAAKPVPWTHEETVHLIQTYQHTWYSLNRTHLRAPHWDSVSSTVASLCSYPPSHPSLKSPSQCCHKLEKLRRRYRAERQRILDGTQISSTWPYYDLMDRLERGPLPITAIPIKTKNSEDDEESEEERMENRRVRSVDYILRRAGVVNRFAVGGGRVRDRVSEEEGEEERRKKRREAVMKRVAAEVRGLAERYVGVEEVKIEMARETERWKMDMERRRLEMILDSERKVVDAIARAFAS